MVVDELLKRIDDRLFDDELSSEIELNTRVELDELVETAFKDELSVGLSLLTGGISSVVPAPPQPVNKTNVPIANE